MYGCALHELVDNIKHKSPFGISFGVLICEPVLCKMGYRPSCFFSSLNKNLLELKLGDLQPEVTFQPTRLNGACHVP